MTLKFPCHSRKGLSIAEHRMDRGLDTRCLRDGLPKFHVRLMQITAKFAVQEAEGVP